MILGKPGFDIIKLYEQGPRGGPALKAYLCPADVWTIGYGHTRKVKMGDTCTVEQAEKWLMEDVAESVRAVNELVKVPLNQNQFDALVSFVFNVGADQFSSSTLLRVLNGGFYKDAAAQFKRWNKSKGQVLNGLVLRRKDEADLFLTPWE